MLVELEGEAKSATKGSCERAKIVRTAFSNPYSIDILR